MIKETNKNTSQRGFTLIELSIVLVIIGLIVGGVLSGQDLIKAAEVRATVKQVETFNLAANTFRVKYANLPGDAAAANAPTGAVTYGNGDGVILDGASGIALSTGEILAFWQHLSLANLIDGNYDGVTATPAPGTQFPQSKLGRAAGWHVYSVGGLNYFQLGGAVQTSTTIVTKLALTPSEALNIDTKLDDGKPNTGTVRAQGGVAGVNAAASAGATGVECTSAATVVGVYNINNLAPLCQLRVQASF